VPAPWHATRSLDGYLDWCVETLDYWGFIDGYGYLRWEDLATDDPISDDDFQLALIPEQGLRFFDYDGATLRFHQLVTRDCLVLEYGYHLMHDDGRPIARLCKQMGSGHPGGPVHLHRGPDPRDVEPCSPYDLDDAIEFLRAFLPGVAGFAQRRP
jgi:hypothetical protein